MHNQINNTWQLLSRFVPWMEFSKAHHICFFFLFFSFLGSEYTRFTLTRIPSGCKTFFFHLLLFSVIANFPSSSLCFRCGQFLWSLYHNRLTIATHLYLYMEFQRNTAQAEILLACVWLLCLVHWELAAKRLHRNSPEGDMDLERLLNDSPTKSTLRNNNNTSRKFSRFFFLAVFVIILTKIEQQ